MSNIQIKQVDNNKDKQRTYAAQLSRYRRAMNGGFYFESLLIVYSLLEDRLAAILYYAGVLQNRKELKISKSTKLFVNEIYKEQYGENATIQLKRITGKMDLISSIIKWEMNVQQIDEKEVYYYELKSIFEDIDVGGMLDIMDELRGWLAYRNEVIHASMNKNIEDLYENLPGTVEKGMEYVRFIDSQVKIMKKSNRVRKALKMQNN